MVKPSSSSIPRPSYQPSRVLPSSYPSPRTIYSDRFIPSRIGSNFTLFDLSPSPSASSSSDVSGREYGSGAYAALLRNALFGPDQGVAPPATPDRSAEAAGRRSSSAASSTYKADVPRYSLAAQFEDGLPGFPHIHPRAPRKVSPSPYKVGSLFVFRLEVSL
ncbi:hypothetical protein B296_00044561 [Ensete ventricosum]|uniref:Uncharacterized protein n=1 Tax=Ensete ventricosum TaxID=4639 RepID=A0A426YHQ1_ENSVE|nr:hypothetical protein B296_00044561 [Ensete ventricosum]